ncbi:MAG: serpin family protein [Bacteroidales bacterium]|nr:serpin family protein [Bacteroidales bacterium]
MKTDILFLITIFLFTASCEKQENTGEPKQINISKTTEQVVEADNLFGINLFQTVLANDTTDNIFISPTSVALALAMTYNGADGTTKKAMEETLRKQGLTPEELNQSYKDLIAALVSADPKVLREIANSIWYREDIQVLPDFVNTNETYYDAEVSSLVFDNMAKEIINGWVADKTHDKIKEVIDNIPADAIMYLINAIYFKGVWRSAFDADETTNRPFYLTDGSVVEVPTMKQRDTIRYLSNDLISAVELPYGEGNFSMIVMLPNDGKTTGDVVSAMSIENWDSWMQAFSERDVLVNLPQLKFEYKRLLNQELTGMGMGVAFTSEADFPGINPSLDLFISRVIHKTFVEVNEDGTEAAAVTVVEVSLTAMPGEVVHPVYFLVNKPFIFAIREKDTGTILFIGRVNNPLKH